MKPNVIYKRTVVVVENDDFLRSLIADSLEKAGFNVATAANGLDAKRMIFSILYLAEIVLITMARRF